ANGVGIVAGYAGQRCRWMMAGAGYPWATSAAPMPRLKAENMAKAATGPSCVHVKIEMPAIGAVARMSPKAERANSNPAMKLAITLMAGLQSEHCRGRTGQTFSKRCYFPIVALRANDDTRLG